jgi:hypothetical protein
MNHLNPKTRIYTATSLRLYGALSIMALVLAVPATVGVAQAQSNKAAPLSGQGAVAAQRQALAGSEAGDGEYDSTITGRRAKMMDSERRKLLVTDSDKLLKLATELNNQIAHSNPGSLTPDQLRMVAEIEKLARSVRDKMTMTVPPTSGNLFPRYGPQFR